MKIQHATQIQISFLRVYAHGIYHPRHHQNAEVTEVHIKYHEHETNEPRPAQKESPVLHHTGLLGCKVAKNHDQRAPTIA
jgi:hypothetical protein